MDADLLKLDDLPDDARNLLDAAEREEIAIRDRAERQAERIRSQADRKAAQVEAAAEDEVRALERRLLSELKPLQDHYAREGKLDEALAIRERIRGLKVRLLRAQPDPGSLADYEDTRVGHSVL